MRLAATVLARLAGEQAASDTFGIDRRTVRGWVKREDVPTDSWAALDELAGAQLLEKVARGQVTNATTLATVRGIASRNRRYAEVIAAREARREAEGVEEEPESKPIHDAMDSLDPQRRRLLADTLKYELRRRRVAGEPEPDASAPPVTEVSQSLMELIEELRDRSDEDVAAESKRINAGMDALDAVEEERVRPTPPPDQPTVEPTPPPTARAARPRSAPMLIDAGGRSEPWYDLETGERRRSYPSPSVGRAGVGFVTPRPTRTPAGHEPGG